MKRPYFLLSLLALLSLASCSTKQDHRVVIRYMAWGNPEQLALEEQLCDQFSQENPDILVKFLKVPGSAYSNKTVVMLASDTAPDVLRVDHYNFGNLQKKRFFYDLTPLAAKDPEFHEDDFFPQAIGECKVGNQLYGLSVLFGATVIYYNKTMIQSAGLDDPYQLWKEGKWTYRAFTDLATKLTKKDKNGKPSQFGTALPTAPQWVPLIWGFGGDIFDPKTGKCSLDSTESIQGLQFAADLRYKIGCAPTLAQSANSSFSFESGKLGMSFDWMGMTPRYRKVVKSFEWDVVPIPTGPVSGATVVKGNQLVMPANCAHPEAAWRFMRFLTSPKIENLLYVQNRRCFPTRKAIAESKEFLANDKPPKQIHIFLDAVKTGRALPIDDRWAEWTQVMNNELDRLWNGADRDVARVAKRAAEAVNKVREEEPGW